MIIIPIPGLKSLDYSKPLQLSEDFGVDRRIIGIGDLRSVEAGNNYTILTGNQLRKAGLDNIIPGVGKGLSFDTTSSVSKEGVVSGGSNPGGGFDIGLDGLFSDGWIKILVIVGGVALGVKLLFD